MLLKAPLNAYDRDTFYIPGEDASHERRDSEEGRSWVRRDAVQRGTREGGLCGDVPRDVPRGRRARERERPSLACRLASTTSRCMILLCM